MLLTPLLTAEANLKLFLAVLEVQSVSIDTQGVADHLGCTPRAVVEQMKKLRKQAKEQAKEPKGADGGQKHIKPKKADAGSKKTKGLKDTVALPKDNKKSIKKEDVDEVLDSDGGETLPSTKQRKPARTKKPALTKSTRAPTQRKVKAEASGDEEQAPVVMNSKKRAREEDDDQSDDLSAALADDEGMSES